MVAKKKIYKLHWEATIRGTQTVEAFDEEDAQDQFSDIQSVKESNEPEVYAELLDVVQLDPYQ